MKKFILKYLLSLSAFIISASMALQAQQAEAMSTLDKGVIRIGEQSVLTLSVKAPKGLLVNWPLIGDTIMKEIEILDKSAIDTVADGEYNNYVQKLTITSFDSGYYAIPPFVFHIKTHDGTDMVETEALLYEVHTVTVDTTANIKNIKSLAKMPVVFREIVPYLVGVVLLAALTLGAIYLTKQLRKKKKVVDIIIPKVKISPYKYAIEEFNKLIESKLWQKGEIKEYYFRITEILREYVGGEFDIDAPEMLTYEVVAALQHSGKVESGNIEKIKNMMELSDMVKFAKYIPEESHHETIIHDAIDFVNDTHDYHDKLKSQTQQSGGGDV